MISLGQRTKEVATNELRFVYDGWNLIGTLNSSFNILNSFAWGLDLSGWFQGAGGIGGLLWVNNGSASTHFVSYDGNGNVTALVNAADGSESARYEYGPFGEVIRATGSMAKQNPFRFCTKYQDDESDLLYYGYRYYSASTGRWMSRDPIGEESFLHWFSRGASTEGVAILRYNSRKSGDLFVLNDPIARCDLMGLITIDDINLNDYPELDPKHPEKPSKRKVCLLIRSYKPGSIFNAGCGQCWRCDYQCKPSASGAPFITRFQIDGCLEKTGYVPGWAPTKKDECETADPSEALPVQGIPPGEI